MHGKVSASVSALGSVLADGSAIVHPGIVKSQAQTIA